MQHDVVPRASLKALEALRDEVSDIHWEQRLRDKVPAFPKLLSGTEACIWQLMEQLMHQL